LDKKSFIALIIIVFLLSMSATIYLYSRTFFVELKSVYAEVEIGESPGINGDRESLMFGRIIANASSEKKVNVKNSRNKEVVADITVQGSIAPLLKFEKYIVIPPGEQKSISISAYDAGYPLGNYTGNVFFKISGRKSPFAN